MTYRPTASALVLTAALTAAGTFHAHGQTEPTTAELTATIAQLRLELAALRTDYGVLLATCHGQRDSQPPPSPQATQTPPTPPPDPQPSLDDSSWFVKAATYGVTQSNEVFIRFGWNVTINNGAGRRPRMFNIEVHFLDGRGLVIDTARAYRQVVGAFGEHTFHGSHLVTMPSALSVAAVRAVATPLDQ